MWDLYTFHCCYGCNCRRNDKFIIVKWRNDRMTETQAKNQRWPMKILIFICLNTKIVHFFYSHVNCRSCFFIISALKHNVMFAYFICIHLHLLLHFDFQQFCACDQNMIFIFLCCNISRSLFLLFHFIYFEEKKLCFRRWIRV